jgi:hypothetical protein
MMNIQVSIDPLLMEHVMELGDELLPPRLWEQILRSALEERGSQLEPSARGQDKRQWFLVLLGILITSILTNY